VRYQPERKRVQPAKKIERQGIALIGKVVADMGHLWNEPQNDFGTDGSIELVDPTTEKATNGIVLVQSKATSVPFDDRPVGFTCDEDDLRYWLHGNAPVILIRLHPGSDQAYWVSVKDYFREHPEQRASCRILFDRDRDRFDTASAPALWQLARPRVDGLHLGTPPIHEVLVMNLLPVDSIPERIHVADATIRRGREARAVWCETAGDWPRDWIVWSGRIYSFTHLGTGLLSQLCASPVTSFPSSDWADAEDDELRHRFVWLLKGSLSVQMRPALRSSNDLTWVAPTDDLPVLIDIPTTSTTRTVVKEYLREDGTTRYATTSRSRRPSCATTTGGISSSRPTTTSPATATNPTSTPRRTGRRSSGSSDTATSAATSTPSRGSCAVMSTWAGSPPTPSTRFSASASSLTSGSTSARTPLMPTSPRRRSTRTKIGTRRIRLMIRSVA
jgi:hypothetical protein